MIKTKSVGDGTGRKMLVPNRDRGRVLTPSSCLVVVLSEAKEKQ